MELPSHIRSQYVETLIDLIKKNIDHTWLPYFLKIREGGYLPGGGAGSLNDWGPMYGDLKPQVWYTVLYDILRYLFDNDLTPEYLNNSPWIKAKDKIQVIRCLNCNKSYQHPHVFEYYFANDFYAKNFQTFIDGGSLQTILDEHLSFNTPAVDDIRSWLLAEYKQNDIKVFDFISAHYRCPHCKKVRADTEHDLYKADSSVRTFTLIKQNSSYSDTN
jgi:phage FluMu protein Com